MDQRVRRFRLSTARALLVFAAIAFVSGCASVGQNPPGNPNNLPTNPNENQRAAQINTELGVGYMNEGHMDVAVEKIKRAIYFDNNFAPAHHAYALMLDRLGEAPQAGVEFEKAYALDPNNSDLDNNYGTYLCGQKNYARAQSLFSRAYGDPLYKTPEFALTNSGVCYEAEGNKAQSLAQYQAALDKSPGYGPALIGLARVNFAQKNYAAAAAAIKTFEASNRNTPDTLQLAIRIDRATGDQTALANHVLILKGRFPDSAAAQWYDSGAK
ncbi:MAG: type IV pilus biogenesis/stability protein PilW [Halothiobacillus sp. 24-54-40]|jgi:type IV pilus assembly protein PilF|nr:MAG: type IV pilus biogenesis/stability protein PilW [Halothiobacillus sp. 35-54-62]OYZ87443.1 MAG: type IV pilus biogenesis/stability protein PilW [Halothiobacillus sp. 24-54-40]OZA80924.1 MAG: type IV pilus biogenesis/stability protein PilW [Halothiobacillus sp. 39-53-45]HQS02579.1 type IV pilus biogenesis/stability protein PilW [Halothiobacillus sp.]HQS28489.1 type IV pilus biogenesis/stability protein PilW [Halothiobacillus sp.]